MKILVTGGAGYIGSICVEQLINQDHEVIVIDNLQEGNREAVLPEAVFYEGDFGDSRLLDAVFQNHSVDVVIHFAAETTIEISMTEPAIYFQNNVVKGLILLNAMRKYSCDRFIFSSTAAVFGNPQYTPIDEKHQKKPINAYGESKLMFESMLDWYHTAYGLKFNAFRYFNAAGASGILGEAHRHESHLIPIIVRTALGKHEKLCIFGSDYETKDGTCIRDYLHVIDIAQAHILSLDNLQHHPNAKYNLGSETGYSNLEVLRVVETVSGITIPYELTERRTGDPDRLVASSQLAKKELGWKPDYQSLEAIVQSAWDWHSRNPHGYSNWD